MFDLDKPEDWEVDYDTSRLGKGSQSHLSDVERKRSSSGIWKIKTLCFPGTFITVTECARDKFDRVLRRTENSFFLGIESFVLSISVGDDFPSIDLGRVLSIVPTKNRRMFVISLLKEGQTTYLSVYGFGARAVF